MKFAKMQGTGNDYIYVNCFDESIDDPPAAAKFLSDRISVSAQTGLC